MHQRKAVIAYFLARPGPATHKGVKILLSFLLLILHYRVLSPRLAHARTAIARSRSMQRGHEVRSKVRSKVRMGRPVVCNCAGAPGCAETRPVHRPHYSTSSGTFTLQTRSCPSGTRRPSTWRQSSSALAWTLPSAAGHMISVPSSNRTPRTTSRTLRP